LQESHNYKSGKVLTNH